MNRVELENERIRMVFDEDGRLNELAASTGKVRIPIGREALTCPFAIDLRGRGNEVTRVVPETPPVMKRADEGDCRVLLADWSLAGDWGEMTVRAKVILPADSPTSEWLMEVHNGTDKAIWQVSFPRISGLGAFEGLRGPDWLAAPFQVGEKLPNPVAFVNGRAGLMNAWAHTKPGSRDSEGPETDLACSYPGMWTMQFLAYGHPLAGGIYFGAHDGQALYKRFGMYADGPDGNHAALVLKQYPDDRTATGADFASFYPASVGVYEGDWPAASEIYREWALRQTWCARGPTKDRDDIPAWTKDLDLWYWNWQFPERGHPAYAVGAIQHLKERFGCEVAFHWYGFNGELFDAAWREPEVFPENRDIRETLIAGVRRLHNVGVRCIPYINCRLWNPDNHRFREAGGRKWLAADEDGNPGDEWLQLGCAMCPTARPLHEILRQIVNQMIDECEMDGAYLDQVTSCFAVPCFNPEHDHPPGGHDHWHRGYRTLLDEIQRDIKTRSPANVITSESVIECFLDLFDLDLGYNLTDLGNGLCRMGSPAGLPIPMFQSVYHDYHMTYGTHQVLNQHDLAHFRYAEGLCLISGQQIGISGFFTGDEERAELEPYLAYVETLTRAHVAARKWLNLGVWKPPLALQCRRVPVSFSQVHPPKADIPAILNGCFRLDGEVCIVFVNHTADAQVGTFTMSPEQYGLNAEAFRLRSIFPGRPDLLLADIREPFAHRVELPPASVKVLTLAPHTRTTAEDAGQLETVDDAEAK